ncbi:MAG: 6-carboxytetrahydropterin synthase [Bacteroidia bacterium]|nr:6-carboxytetrahydropterin synthase [Bacteroidia bacterium]
MKTSVFRKASFNAAHRLYNPKWSNEKNDEIFGLCNNPNFHGHNYDLIVKVTGYVDAETGYVIDLKLLSDIIKEKVTDRYDHRNLNLDFEEFKTLNPTAENIARVIYELLRSEINSELDLKIILYETPRNFVEYPA